MSIISLKSTKLKRVHQHVHAPFTCIYFPPPLPQEKLHWGGKSYQQGMKHNMQISCPQRAYSDGVHVFTTQFTQHKGHWQTCDYLWWPDWSTVVIATHCSTLPSAQAKLGGQKETNLGGSLPPGKITAKFRKTPLGRKKQSAKNDWNKLHK